MPSTQYLRIASTGEPVRLGGAELPGIVTGLEVAAELRVEKKELEDTDGSVKLLKGFRDATVTLSLSILPPNAEAQVKSIEAAFKKGSGAGKATIYRIVNPSLDARNITTVLFQRFVSAQSSEDDQTLCTLTFVEYLPVKGAGPAGSTPITSGPAAGVGADPGPGGAGGGSAPAAPQTPAVLQGIANGQALATGSLGGP